MNLDFEVKRQLSFCGRVTPKNRKQPQTSKLLRFQCRYEMNLDFGVKRHLSVCGRVTPNNRKLQNFSDFAIDMK